MACLVTIEEPGLRPSLHMVLVLFLLFVVVSVCEVFPLRVLCIGQGQVPGSVGVQMFLILANLPSPRSNSLISLQAMISSTLILHCRDRVLQGNLDVCMITCLLYIHARQ